VENAAYVPDVGDVVTVDSQGRNPGEWTVESRYEQTIEYRVGPEWQYYLKQNGRTLATNLRNITRVVRRK